jgi:hypothetical protein
MDVKKRYGGERKIGLTMVCSNIILVSQYFAGMKLPASPARVARTCGYASAGGRRGAGTSPVRDTAYYWSKKWIRIRLSLRE